MTMRSPIFGAFSALCLALAASPAIAQDNAAGSSFWDDFELQIGAGAIFAPEYEGSDRYDLMPAPIIDLSWRDRIFLSFGALRADLSPLENLSFGPLLTYDPGRENDDSRDLRGTGNVGDTFEGGFFITYEHGPFELSNVLRTALGGGHEGTVISPSVAYNMEVTSKLGVSLEVGATWADDNYNSTFFGIDARQSARSGLRRFDADAGFKNVDISLSGRYAITDHWGFIASAGYSRLVGDAADSPLVDDRGSRNQGQVLFGMSYRF